MYTFVYGNIRHRNYVYLCSKPDFFEDIKRTWALDSITRYDITCKHGELALEQHQSFGMLTSDLNSGITPRLLLFVSGAEEHRNGRYAQGYLCADEDGDIYGVDFLKLLNVSFQSCSEVINTSRLESLTIGSLPQEELQSRNLPREQMAQILTALLQKKRVVIRLKEVGKEAMQASRETVMAIFERLPYEFRRSNGYLTGASRKLLQDAAQPLPKAFSVVLLDEDADITGIQSDRETFFLDLCQPEISMSVPDEMKTLVQFLADTAPGELEPFFAFCRQVRDLERNGTPLDCCDYSMLLSIFRADSEKVTDDRMRSWAVELFGNRRKKEAKAFLYDRLARVLTPQRLTQFLLKELPEDQKIESLGSPTKDLNGVKAIFLAQELWQRWSDDCKADSLVDKLTNWATEICLRQNEALLNPEKPTVAAAQELDILLDRIAPNADLPLARKIQETVYRKIKGRCDEIRQEVAGGVLCFIPEALSPEEAKGQLRTVIRMQNDGLTEGDVSFPAWEEIGSARRILREIEAIEAYRIGENKPQPRLVNPRKRAWVRRWFPDNKDLQIALAKQEENGRVRLTEQWARREDTGKWVETLYIHCWPEELLKRGAGEATSESWRHAVEAHFPPHSGEQE